MTKDINEMLLAACKRGSKQHIKHWVNKGANINYEHDIPVMFAIRSSNIEAVKECMKIGSNIKRSTSFARIACEVGNMEILKFLLKNKAQMDEGALVAAAEYDNAEIVEFLIKKGMDIHFNEDEALIKCAQHGYDKTFKVCIFSGANITARNHNALRVAVKNDHVGIVSFILESNLIPPQGIIDMAKSLAIKNDALKCSYLLNRYTVNN